MVGPMPQPGAVSYDVVIATMTETDGESSYQVFVNDRKIGQFTNPVVDRPIGLEAKDRFDLAEVNLIGPRVLVPLDELEFCAREHSLDGFA